MKPALQNYQARMRRVLDYFDRHLDSDLDLETDIAMDAGYDAPDAFARAFRQRFGQSPSSFRKSPDWEPWLAAFWPLDNAIDAEGHKIAQSLSGRCKH